MLFSFYLKNISPPPQKKNAMFLSLRLLPFVSIKNLLILLDCVNKITLCVVYLHLTISPDGFIEHLTK